eukprot:CAMPEP_0181303136 /NCGR_PEP_ID=MMETSP1101-20121128/8385_1 /TAXON_ID=46948 /ORGANISM="Rhodomonas abbreviata, Strain Caron Lab Isolate" /LENGTH=251 /DNA_ID=CAMNT_0023408665 /DNA_START=59 /DNA_END=811 /DNA_ORIENTATION=-
MPEHQDREDKTSDTMPEHLDTAVASRRRPRMNPELAEHIFLQRPLRSTENKFYGPSALLSNALAAKYNLLERTVRNIWNRRSWTDTTRPLWTEEEIAAEMAAESHTETIPGAGEVVPVKDRKRGRPRTRTEDQGKQRESLDLLQQGDKPSNSAAVSDEIAAAQEFETIPGAGEFFPAKDRKRGRPRNRTDDQEESRESLDLLQQGDSSNNSAAVADEEVVSSAQEQDLWDPFGTVLAGDEQEFCDPFGRDW